MRPTRAILVAAALAAGGFGAAAAETPAPPTMWVSAIGSVDVLADELQITLSVVSQAEGAPAALKDNNDRIAGVLKALHEMGLTADEVSTANFRINPRYQIDPQGYTSDGAGKLIGYGVENAVRVKTKKIARAGEIIQKAIESGADRVQGVSFGLADPLAKRPDAIREAIRMATRDAEVAASASGVRLAGMRSLNVDPSAGGGGIFNYGGEYASARMSSVGPDLSPSSVPVTATVRIEYEIAPNK